jgi:flagellar biosynthetic protein FlhB
MSDNRTEKPTHKRREDARKRGQIPRSNKLPGAIGFLAGLMVLKATGNDWLKQALNMFSQTLSHAGDNINLTQQTAEKIFVEAVWSLAILIAPVTITILVSSLAANFLQTRFAVTLENLFPKFERLNPVANVKRIFSSQSLIDMLKDFAELTCLFSNCYSIFLIALTDIPKLVGLPVRSIIFVAGELFFKIGIRAGAVLILFALIDYGYQWYKHEKSLKMTKQELKDEFRNQEGDPLIKGQRRRAARALVQRRSLLDVHKAQVIITNPTHFAVALAYDKDKSPAPIVLAKGADLLALRIREIATENDICIVENPPLARALYREVELGQVIPSEFFRAVAEVLAYVYQRQATASFR